MDRHTLYNMFQMEFPLDSLKELPIDKYTNLNKKDSFCYWLETKTAELGSIRGGSSYKFGIYKYNKLPNSSETMIQSDNEYAWYVKYGKKTAIEAYLLVRDAVVRIAEYARNGDFESIEGIDVLGNTVKWKIAFLYSECKLVPIYNKEMLEIVSEHLGLKEAGEKSISEIQNYLVSIKGDKDIFEYCDELLKYWESVKKVNAWIYSPGEKARKWEECLAENIMLLGWDELGDLKHYSSKDEIKKQMKEIYGDANSYRNDSLSIWQFLKEVNIGDVVYVKKGRNNIIGRGVVTGDYEYNGDKNEFKHCRKVEWEINGDWVTTKQFAMKTLTKLSPLQKNEIDELMSGKASVEVQNVQSENFWWLCANPKIWSMKNWPVGEDLNYTLYNESGNKRRIFKNFLDAKVGDKIICYEATPVKQIVALAEISKPNDGEVISFKKTHNLLSPIDYSEVKDIPELSNMEFFTNPNGSFFKLTKAEYDTIIDMIQDDCINTGSNSIAPYTDDDFLNDVFIERSDLDTLKELILTKKNVILQGAPGVGKTFCAMRLAWVLAHGKDDSRIELIQFHQNYTYEDFVMGYKPDGDSFKIKTGVFYDFCIKASNHPNEAFFFIIDEINRGNLSKIFGELLMLIESGYRGTKLTLAYRNERFAVPKNVHIIGMMNTADRSLALIDYALRRRFSFYRVRPAFDSNGFKDYLIRKDNEHLNKLIEKVKELNAKICSDDSLGSGFEIGHSYFCTDQDITDQWLKRVINYDIIPMLEEYWFDNQNEVKSWKDKLNSIFEDDNR